MTDAETPKIKLSWDTINDAIESLAYMVRPSRPSLIVGISRGGLIPATLLSHKLNTTMAVVSASAYEGTRRTLEKPIHIEGWKPEYDRSDVVVVDDILDSGATLKAIMLATNRTYNSEFKFVTIVNKMCTSFPNHKGFFCQVPRETWVQFPWEQDE